MNSFLLNISINSVRIFENKSFSQGSVLILVIKEKITNVYFSNSQIFFADNFRAPFQIEDHQ